MLSRACRPSPVLRQSVRYNSSFIKHVMEHVKQEMQKDPKSAADWEKLQKSAQKATQGVKNVQEKVSPSYSKAKDMFSKMKAAAGPSADKSKEPAVEPNPVLASVRSKFAALAKSPAVSAAASRAQSAVSAVVERGHKLFARFDETPQKPELHAKWQAEQAFKTRESTAESTPHPHANSLVVSEEKQSAWDRMGLGADTMPYLRETFGTILGESEIAQCTREMKLIDGSFRLSYLIDEVERVVAPKFLQWFLEGNATALKAHCGEAAYAACHNSIKGRVTQKCKPDTRVLLGPRDIELKMAIPAETEGASPCFVFGFNTQQLNCFRDFDGKVVEGAVDDIREIHYLLAIQRNLVEDQTALEHQWLIREIAIVGNRRTW